MIQTVDDRGAASTRLDEADCSSQGTQTRRRRITAACSSVAGSRQELGAAHLAERSGAGAGHGRDSVGRLPMSPRWGGEDTTQPIDDCRPPSFPPRRWMTSSWGGWPLQRSRPDPQEHVPSSTHSSIGPRCRWSSAPMASTPLPDSPLLDQKVETRQPRRIPAEMVRSVAWSIEEVQANPKFSDFFAPTFASTHHV